MKKLIYLISVVFSIMVIFGQEELLEVKGKVLYKDQVNSLKPPMPILDVPQSVNIVTDIDIRNQGFREIGDIIRYTPGVNTSQGEGHRDAVVFRGVRSTADFYQDGVRDDVQYFRSLYNVDQLEIIKGSNALLFGRGGTGGLINRVSKTAQLGETFGTLDSGADTFGGADVALDGNIQVSDNIAFRLNFHADSLANHRDLYSGDRVGINPTMKFQVDSTTTIDLSYEYADHERFVDRGIPVDDSTGGTYEPIEALKDFTIGTRDDNRTTLEANILRGSLNHDYADNGKLNFSVAVNDFRKMYRNFYANDYAAGVVEIDGYFDETARESTIISLSNVNEFARATLAVGLEIIDTQSSNIRYNTFFSNNKSDKESFVLTSNTPRPLAFNVNSGGTIVYNDYSADINNKSDTDIEVTSIYLTSNIDLADQWKMVLGARYDDVSVKIKQYGLTTPTSGVNEKKTTLSGTDENQGRDDAYVSPRFGLIYKPQENMSLYLSYSESFLPRSDEQYKTFDGKSCGTAKNCEKYDPDTFENTEVGFKYDMDSGLSLSFSYFDMEQTRAAEDGTGGTEVRALAIDGFEFALGGPVNDTHSIKFGLSAVDATAGAGSTAKPKEVPELTYSLWWTNEVTDIFDISLGLTYQDESFIKADPGPVLPAYTRIDMGMTITPNDDDVVRINIENLTDEIYYPHSHSTHQASVGESQNMRISYSRRF